MLKRLGRWGPMILVDGDPKIILNGVRCSQRYACLLPCNVEPLV